MDGMDILDSIVKEHSVLNKTKHYMSLTYLIAMQSEDASTHIGAVIVGPDKEIRTTGYNGLPRGCVDMPERQERPEKYFWFEHAERNAIYNAARMGASLKDCYLFVNAIPCADCARAIIQSGISHVVFHFKFENEWDARPMEDRIRSIKMMKEAGVKVTYYDKEIITNITAQRDGKLVSIM
jgi:dCMP deaminase